jgi:hypothetical protein
VIGPSRSASNTIGAGAGRSVGNTKLNNTYKRSIPSHRRLPIPGITMTVDSVSQLPVSHFLESASEWASPDSAEPQQLTTGFFAAQQLETEGLSSLPSTAHSRSNHCGG